MELTRETKQISYREAHRILTRSGWELIRQKGSHCMYRHPDGRRFLVSCFLGPGYDPRGMKNFIKQLKQAIAGEDTFKPRI